jgi:hypothetical protein
LSREDVLRFVEERIEQLRRELQIYEELRNILMRGEAPVEPTEADLDSLPWRPYQSGTGEWVYQDEAPEALVERLRREGKPVRIGKYLYSLRVGATGKTFVSRREAKTE